ncbi:PaaI family thioesterase [Qipengyuania sp. MTN3-11]|uniref:PaaI family thioesterase n=1 Tax=Qipengyuania sp. MTN3-11 TaxID=3056557 RepID=UPI0036F43DE2
MVDRHAVPILTPYARALGIELESWDGMAPVVRVGFSEAVLGRPGALHGGAISGLLETAGYGALRAELSHMGREARLKPINITVQFLRSGKEKPSFACARIAKLGRRTANLSVEAWQDDRAKPIASAVMNVMIVESAA